mmetsp:Transcript_26034/g.28959  ORF Transcript_26034/g.28959 Transcript_26034/m.28959 type:complete len:93 (-) Transcript_26034:870-1148(-)
MSTCPRKKVIFTVEENEAFLDHTEEQALAEEQKEGNTDGRVEWMINASRQALLPIKRPSGSLLTHEQQSNACQPRFICLFCSPKKRAGTRSK